MAKLGNVMKAYLKVSSTYTWLTGEQTNSVNLTADAIEVSDKSTDWKQYIAGAKGGTIEVTVFADNSDSVQQEAMTQFRAGAEVDFLIGVLGTGSYYDVVAAARQVLAGKQVSEFGSIHSPVEETGRVLTTAVSDTNDYGAVSTRNLSLQITGEPTHYDTTE